MISQTRRLIGQPSGMTTHSWGLLLLLCSAFCFSIMGVFVKLASRTGLPSTELVLFRAAFQGIFIVAAMFHMYPTSPAQGAVKDEDQVRPLICHPFGGTWEVQHIVLARGFFGGLSFILYFFTIKALPLGDAITLFSLYPIYTIFLAAVFLNEPVMLFHCLSTICSILGAICISKPPFLFGSRDTQDSSEVWVPPEYQWIGYGTAILGSLSGAIVLTLVRQAGNVGAHTLQLLFSWATFGVSCSLVFGPILAPIDGGGWRLPRDAQTWGYLLGMGFFGSIALSILNYAGRVVPAGVASLVRSSDILWAYVWQVVVFSDVPDLFTCAGVSLVATSLGLVAWQQSLALPEAPPPSLPLRGGKPLLTREESQDSTSDEEGSSVGSYGSLESGRPKQYMYLTPLK